jgi:hypothetical protein
LENIETFEHILCLAKAIGSASSKAVSTRMILLIHRYKTIYLKNHAQGKTLSCKQGLSLSYLAEANRMPEVSLEVKKYLLYLQVITEGSRQVFWVGLK